VGRNIWQRDRKTGEETLAAIAKLTRNVKFQD
jgi:class I fructose-bisphosphate aldolase